MDVLDVFRFFRGFAIGRVRRRRGGVVRNGSASVGLLSTGHCSGSTVERSVLGLHKNGADSI